MENLIVVKNMTELIKREKLIYAIGDLGLPVAVSVTRILLLLLGVVLFALVPWILFPNIPLVLLLSLIAFGLFFGWMVTKNLTILQGKKLYGWLSEVFNYLSSPKYYYDGVGIAKLKDYEINSTFLIDRRDDFALVKKWLEDETK